MTTNTTSSDLIDYRIRDETVDSIDEQLEL